MNTEKLPDFEPTETPASPPRRQRKPQKVTRTAAPRRKIASTARNAATLKRARKKRAPRRLPGHASAAIGNTMITPPNVAPEAAGVIRAYMNLDEAQRAVVAAFIGALR